MDIKAKSSIIHDNEEAISKDPFADLSELVNRIELIIAGASVRKMSGEDLIKELRHSIAAYPQMKAQAYYVAINNAIDAACERNGITRFTNDEIMKSGIFNK